MVQCGIYTVVAVRCGAVRCGAVRCGAVRKERNGRSHLSQLPIKSKPTFLYTYCTVSNVCTTAETNRNRNQKAVC